MNTDHVQIKMLGDFSIRMNGQEISDSDNRSRKVWLLLAYMIHCRKRSITQDELINLLWDAETGSSNPGNALKTMFHRVRTMLNQLGNNAGHLLVIRREGSYAWNPAVPLILDVDEFEALVKKAGSANGDEKLDLLLRALELYTGDFLAKLADESWCVPLSAYFHNLYVQAVQEALSLLEDRGRLQEASKICRKATELEPYDEALYIHLMRELLDLGDQKGVLSVYQNMSDLLFENFGVMPSDESKAIYREAVKTVNEREVSLGFVREQLKEPGAESGALFCDYDFFRVIYHAEARAVARSGDAVHIGLITVSGAEGELSRRSLDICMDNLQELLCSSLRKGDITSRCSLTQFIVLLPQANYENSCMVMERIIRAFARRYPHSPAALRYSVQPLEPNA